MQYIIFTIPRRKINPSVLKKSGSFIPLIKNAFFLQKKKEYIFVNALNLI